jgi:DNA-binding MarR family transcriptional regulator
MARYFSAMRPGQPDTDCIKGCLDRHDGATTILPSPAESRAAFDRDGSSNRTLAERLGWSETKTSRFVDRLVEAGKVRKVRTGQSVAITLN